MSGTEQLEWRVVAPGVRALHGAIDIPEAEALMKERRRTLSRLRGLPLHLVTGGSKKTSRKAARTEAKKS